MIAAVLIPVDGAMTRVDVGEDAAGLAAAIGCTTIQLIGIDVDGLRLAIDEEGLLTGAAPNLHATILAERVILGDALLVGVDLDDSIVDLTPADLQQLAVPA